MLLTAEGTPAPPSEIVSRLKQVHPQYGLRFVRRWDGSPWWAITWEWAEGDPRWREVVAGVVRHPEETFDILAHLPGDCPPDEAYGYLVNGLKRWDRKDIRDTLNWVDQYNKGVTKKIGDDIIEETLEGINPRYLFQNEKGVIPRSFGGIETVATTEG